MQLNVVLAANLPTEEHIKIFFDRAINSLSLQTYKNFFLTVVLNGVYDYNNSIIVIENKLKKQYKHSFINDINIYKTPEKLGVSKAVNIGIKMVDADLIAFQAADDTSEKQRFEKQINCFLEKKDLDVCGGGMFEMREQTLHTHSPFVGSYENFRNLMPNMNLLMAGSVMCKKKILEKVNYFNENFKLKQVGEDYDLWKRLAAAGANIYNINEPLYTWYHDYSTFL